MLLPNFIGVFMNDLVCVSKEADVYSGDYYLVLGVKKTATTKEIKKAFIKLSAKYHPDKGGDAETFNYVKKAYNILSNLKSRLHYNEHGAFSDEEVAKANRYLIQLITFLIDDTENLDTLNISQKLFNITKDNIETVEDDLIKLDGAIIRLAKSKKRTTSDIILNVLNTKIGVYEETKVLRKEDLKMFTIALTLADDIVYDFDEPPQQQHSTFINMPTSW